MELDDRAYINLRELQPGDLFTLRSYPNTVVRCDEVKHPVELEPIVRGWEMEGPKGRRTSRMFRAIRISDVGTILPKE